MIALEGEWKQCVGGKHLLSSPPEKQSTYEVHVRGSIKGLQQFWCVYMRPCAQLNGFECESDISSVVFCLCQPTEVISTGGNIVRIEVVVINTASLRNLRVEDPVFSWMTWLTEQAKSRQYYQVKNYGEFTLIDINIQSNMGLTVIVKKQALKSWIVAANEWGGHKDRWYACARQLNRAEEVMYGIQHGT